MRLVSVPEFWLSEGGKGRRLGARARQASEEVTEAPVKPSGLLVFLGRDGGASHLESADMVVRYVVLQSQADRVTEARDLRRSWWRAWTLHRDTRPGARSMRRVSQARRDQRRCARKLTTSAVTSPGQSSGRK
jgi:hypothetical protein